MLNGTYYFRQVVYTVGDGSADLGDAAAVYGEITFNGNGTYTFSGAGSNGGVVIVDATQGAGALPAGSGTYAIGAGGYGYIDSPAASGDAVFGVVSASGVFVGSSTDNSYGYNDMFIAAKIANPAFTNSNFTGSWTFSDFDPNVNISDLEYYGVTPATNMLNMVFTASPDGSGHFNSGPVKGYSSGVSTPFTQTPTGLPYLFSNGAAVVTFPSNGNYIYGQKYFYFSPDGTFAFGGAPNGYDMIVGVKTTSTPQLSGFYYQAGMDSFVDESGGDLDTWFGAVEVYPASQGQTLVGHQRVNDFGGVVNEQYGAMLYDYTYTNAVALSGNTSTAGTTAFIAGDGGQVLITAGLEGSMAISVVLQAPTATSGTGVYLYPQGVLNAASYAPFTARIAPGELLTLYGSNLASTSQSVVGGTAAPTSLAGVQVTIGGYPAPIFSVVAPSQVSVIVPYEVQPGSVAGIQLTNAMGTSNTVTQIVSNTAPGVFTQTPNGLTYGEIQHLGIGNSVSPVASSVSDGNPAVEGETLAAYLTGLGTVTTGITDGALGPSTASGDPTTNTIAVDFSQTAVGTTDYAGLAPGFAGLYQLNFAIPATGITVGPNYFDIEGYGPAPAASGTTGEVPDSYMQYLLLPIQATPSDTVASSFAAHKLSRARKISPAGRIPVHRVFSPAKAGTAN